MDHNLIAIVKMKVYTEIKKKKTQEKMQEIKDNNGHIAQCLRYYNHRVDGCMKIRI